MGKAVIVWRTSPPSGSKRSSAVTLDAPATTSWRRPSCHPPSHHQSDCNAASRQKFRTRKVQQEPLDTGWSASRAGFVLPACSTATVAPTVPRTVAVDAAQGRHARASAGQELSVSPAGPVQCLISLAVRALARAGDVVNSGSGYRLRMDHTPSNNQVWSVHPNTFCAERPSGQSARLSRHFRPQAAHGAVVEYSVTVLPRNHLLEFKATRIGGTRGPAPAVAVLAQAVSRARAGFS